MSIQLSKPRRILLIIAIMFSNVIIMADYFMYPVLNDLYALFPNDTFAMNFISSGYNLIVLLVSPVAGWFCNRFSKKVPILIGAVCGAIGTCLFFLVKNPIYMCLMRVFYAVGYGFTQICVVAFIAEIYEDPQKRGSFMGYYNAFMTGIGCLMGVVAGYLGEISMEACFSGYWITAVYLVMAILFVPFIKSAVQEPEKKEVQEKKNILHSVSGFGKWYWLTLIEDCIVSFSLVFQSIYCSFYLQETGIGGPALAGILGTIQTLSAAIFAIPFGFVYKKLGHGVTILSSTVALASLLLYRFVPNTFVLYLAFTMNGAAMVFYMTYVYSIAPSFAPKEKINNAIATASMIIAIAGTLRSYIVTFLMDAIGSYMQALIVPLVLAGAAVVLSCVRAKGCKKFAVSYEKNG